MNVSQLAVYQLPSEMHTLRKRNTIPFYNRRRAMNKRDIDFAQAPFQDSHQLQSLEKRTYNTTTSCSTQTVTTTVTVTDCGPDLPTRTSEATQNTTYIGPPLPCMPTPEPHDPDANLSSPDCTCKDSPILPTLTEQLPTATSTTPLVTPTDVAEEGRRIRRAAPDWSRVAYYTSAAPAQATGFSFLANLGDPQKSGTFD
jgi:hypothetical protein